tara:strand:+ start:22832 stop:23551 length:720 start_codon:yes stop_codon:yes gene_type:complete
MEIIKPEDKIILAIDGLNIDESIRLLKVCPNLKWVKVGLELYAREGPCVIKTFKEMGKKIFLDLKFHDIPNTMKSACYEVSKYGVDMISLHSFAGYKALSLSKVATIEGAREANFNPPKVVGITVLTSLSSDEFHKELNIQTSIAEYVFKQAGLCYDAGLDGCVCSPLEVKQLRRTFGNDFKLVTPGIRIKNQITDDQTRVMTPIEALNNGANQLVIGRTITKSSDPQKIFAEICKSIS